ncbi:5'-methylthioadenosine/adenosylhomocysteine nucleosidase [Sulfuricurvum sp.]|uniref:5'-methylthioadenosine/adenosylhomocysteine nucleosidase n=1 Tax=Sulfuricurvum sp. TaxID=2025608 RepID=UPI00198DE967|nr:5'-methylthioadenosine/adenosylhomocysteine nucleosidase [Sulfuricurvum sp.]MBD3798473.1 5'-methylthioadenosine/adenosylhomocysteine nucleosidase [Campylobacterota bacterium]MBD3806275.1 5'-methylthioadenosine/adenosylhomocysteine nucleosidase [Sulfuricurvum sp.]
MKIAIMGAMREEIEPILNTLGEYTSEEYAGNVFYRAEYAGHELVIAYSKIGKVFSAMTASVMLERYGAKVLLFSGVAGGISKDLKIGDLIMASKLCQHDVDITAFGHPDGFIPESSVMIGSDDDLRSLASEIAVDMGIDLYEGIIATGDQFVASSERKSWIGKTFHADALEMEGASVACVCHNFGVPFFVLRAISDTADGSADVDFDTFLQSSAQVSAKFILEMVKRLGD